MYLSHLSLSDFRNYKHLALSLGPGLFLFYGENAQGKTNLLEAVAMLATGNSFHATSDREVVDWYAPEHIARISANVKRHEDDIQIEMVIFDPTSPNLENQAPHAARVVELPANTPRKRVKINTIAKKVLDLIGQMKVVLFAPTDLHLVDGSPDERRRFLDRALCQIQPHYCQALMKYRKIVAQRAALLKRIRDQQEDPQMLNYLDEQLTEVANQIIHERQGMIATLNQHANTIQQTISGGREQLQIVYRPSFKVDATWNATEAPQQHLAQ